MVQLIKCECGLTFIPGDPENKKNHEKIHAEYSLGPDLPSVELASPLGASDNFSIYCIDQTCSLETRQKLAYVAMVAARSMPDYPAGYDGTGAECDQRLFIAVKMNRVVAIVITALDDRFWRCAWAEDGSITLIEREVSIHQRHKITRVWTAAAYRRQGLAINLVKTAACLFSIEIFNLGWELPFTKGGESLVKYLCPISFWGCGDLRSLNTSIHRPKSNGC